jgi:hypothetical protein
MVQKHVINIRTLYWVIRSCLVLILVLPDIVKADVSPVNVITLSDTKIIIDFSASITNVTNPNISIATPPANGTAIKTPNTPLSITYTPNSGYSGIDSFVYQVINDIGQTEMATVTIAVNPPPITGTSPEQLSNFTGSVFTYGANEFAGLTNVITGDLNGDNVTDVIGYLNGQFTVILNSGSGQFTELDNPSIDGAMVLQDMDSDSDLDLLTAKLEIWKNDGTGVFSLAQPAYIIESVSDLDTADMDGDDDADVVLVTNNQVQLWLNDGQGKLVNEQVLNSAANLVELGDLDCDNDIDIFIATSGLDEIWINNETGQFTQLTQPFTNSQTTDVQLGDVDGDNDLDALVSNDTQSLLWMNDGSGNFVFHPQFSLLKATEHRSHLVDLNNDGRLDNIAETQLTLGQNYLRIVSAQMNIGDEIYINMPGTSYFFDSSSTLQSDLTIGDFDNDGFQDILVGDPRNSQILFNNLGRKYGTFLINVNTAFERTDIQVTDRFVQVLESSHSASVSIKPMTTHSSEIKMDYSTTDYTALAGQDYVATSGTLYWAAGDDSEKTIAVELLSDEVKEFGEALNLQLEFSLNQDVVQRVVTPTVMIYDEMPQSPVGECSANNSNTRDPEDRGGDGGGGAFIWGMFLMLFYRILPKIVAAFSSRSNIFANWIPTLLHKYPA